MKAHIITAAVLLMLGVVVAVFLAGIKEKVEERVVEEEREIYKSQLLQMLKDSVREACNYGYSSVSFTSPFTYRVKVRGNKLCVNELCENISCNGSYEGIIGKGMNELRFYSSNGSLEVEG